VLRGPHEAVPVLAIGGAASWAEQVGDAMNLAADNVQSVVIPGIGHWVGERMLAALTAFLAPYRSRPTAAHDPGRMLPPVLIVGKRHNSGGCICPARPKTQRSGRSRSRSPRRVRVRPDVQKLVRPHVQRSGGSIMPCAALVLQSRRVDV
jgi:hypothetical protein